MLAGRRAFDDALASRRGGGRGLRGLLAGKTVMMVGEGDFGFSVALQAGHPAPAVLYATSL